MRASRAPPEPAFAACAARCALPAGAAHLAAALALALQTAVCRGPGNAQRLAPAPLVQPVELSASSASRTAAEGAPPRRTRPPATGSGRVALGFRIPKLPDHMPLPPPLRQEQTLDPALEARSAELRKVALEAWDIFRDRYVDNQGVDWERMRLKLERKKITNERELHAAIEWMLAQAHDQFTRFLPQNELSAMKDDIDGEMCGVGIVFTAETYGWRRTKRVIVKEVVRYSPAADAGLSRGDEITAIDTHSIARMSVDEATNRLLGKQGQKVSLSFIRCDDHVEMSVTLTRRRFTVPTVSGEAVTVSGVGRVAFIQVREFAANTGLQARRMVRKILRNGHVSMYVLDLRGNSGGLVDQAVEFARVFLDRDHTVVRFVGRDGAVSIEKSGMRWLCRQRVRILDEPIVVLVDEATASASELVAAALRDNCRAVIVGASTYGKGSVQAIAQLSDGAGVAVTVAQYRTPSNTPILAGRGLKPDLFRSGMSDDAAAVTQLLGNSPRRLKWIRARLAACRPPSRF